MVLRIIALFSLFLALYGIFLVSLLAPNQSLGSPLVLVTGNPWAGAREKMPINFTVAFAGDQGVTANTRRNMALVRQEGADLFIVGGDLIYDDDSPVEWFGQLTQSMGRDFPLTVALGNHETYRTRDFQQHIKQAMRSSGLDQYCSGEVGVDMTCGYRGFVWYTSSVPDIEPRSGFSLPSELFQSVTWKLCSWHRSHWFLNPEDGQGGTTNTNGMPYSAFADCAREGALIANGHIHSYWRTWVLTDFTPDDYTVLYQNDSSSLVVGLNKTVILGNGVAGEGIGACCTRPDCLAWFSSILCSNYPAADPCGFGTTFCKFNLNGQANEAYCYFKQIDGRIRDEFYLTFE